MSSYSYVNGCYNVTVQIHDGWKRLNKCNAQVQHLISQDGNTEHWNFISYNTPICRVTRHVINGDNVYRVDLSHDWNCSISTQRQLAKFFAMYDLPCNNYMCKELETNYERTACKYMHFHAGFVYFEFVSNGKLESWMRSNACRRNSHPMIIANN